MKQTILIILLLIILGCQENSKPVNLKPITLAEVYPGNILEVDKIELVDGSSGKRKTVENEIEIKKWIGLIKDIELTPDENQEGRAGFRFGISLYNGDKKFGFIPNQINKIYYKTNLEFEGHIKTFFEEQFGREF